MTIPTNSESYLNHNICQNECNMICFTISFSRSTRTRSHTHASAHSYIPGAKCSRGERRPIGDSSRGIQSALAYSGAVRQRSAWAAPRPQAMTEQLLHAAALL